MKRLVHASSSFFNHLIDDIDHTTPRNCQN